MKIILILIATVALICGLGALFLGSSAVHEILGALGILIAVCGMGFSRLIELGEKNKP